MGAPDAPDAPSSDAGKLKPSGSGDRGGGGASTVPLSAVAFGAFGAFGAASDSGPAALQHIKKHPLAAASTCVQTVLRVFTQCLRSGTFAGSRRHAVKDSTLAIRVVRASSSNGVGTS